MLYKYMLARHGSSLTKHAQSICSNNSKASVCCWPSCADCCMVKAIHPPHGCTPTLLFITVQSNYNCMLAAIAGKSGHQFAIVRAVLTASKTEPFTITQSCLSNTVRMRPQMRHKSSATIAGRTTLFVAVEQSVLSASDDSLSSIGARGTACLLLQGLSHSSCGHQRPSWPVSSHPSQWNPLFLPTCHDHQRRP